MTLTITPEDKNTLAITLSDKPTGGDFDDFSGRTFADGGTFGEPGTFLVIESKNTLAITAENKN